jgi:putative redox protein
MSTERPPVVADLVWKKEGLVFEASSRGQSMTLDGDSQAGPSPMMALGFALASCMASDVVHILRKSRADLRALRARLVARRAPGDPGRFLAAELHFEIAGDVSDEKLERAIALSHEKYCSVWHSLRQDIAFSTSFAVERASSQS